MGEHESWHWTDEPVARKVNGVTATQIHPDSRLSPLVAGIRTAVESHADWPRPRSSSPTSCAGTCPPRTW